MLQSPYRNRESQLLPETLSDMEVMYMSSALQVMNMDQTAAEWAARIKSCRSSGLTVKQWCSEHQISPQTYYRWQRRLFDMVRNQQEVQFADVTPEQPSPAGGVAVTVRIAGVEAEIHNGADAAIVEAVLRVLKSC